MENYWPVSIKGYEQIDIRSQNEYAQPLPSGIYNITGPYVVLYREVGPEQENPEYGSLANEWPNPAYVRSQMKYLPREVLVVRYASLRNLEGEELYRGRWDEGEGRRVFEAATEGYAPPPGWGGRRKGAGRPSLGDSKPILFDCPLPLLDKLDARAEKSEQKRAELIRELLKYGLENRWNEQ